MAMRWPILPLGMIAWFFAGLIAGLSTAVSSADANRWGRGYIPNVPVVTQDGRTLRFYDDVIQGRRLVISFIFTSCREMCPLITARLAQVREELGEEGRRQVRFVSISVDPANDTPARLKEHADAFGAAPDWLFLTGRTADIKLIRHKLGDRSENILDHRQDIWLVNDATGDWQRDSAFSDLPQLLLNIHAMVPGGTRTFRAPQRSTSGNMPNLPGQSLYDTACLACHTIGGGDKVGPDLAGVTRRRERAWLSGFIATPQRYHRDKDAAALALAERFKGVRMPNLGLKPNDVVDLIAYIEARTFAVETPLPADQVHVHPARARPSANQLKRAPSNAHHH